MKLLPLVEAVLANVILVALFFWVTGDYSFRASYWGTESFSFSTTRYPLSLVTTGTKGGTFIPGLFTLDWQQVLLLAIVVADAVYISSLLRSRRQAGP